MVYDVLGAGLRVDRAVVPFVTVKKRARVHARLGPAPVGLGARPRAARGRARSGEGAADASVLPEWSSLGFS